MRTVPRSIAPWLLALSFPSVGSLVGAAVTQAKPDGFLLTISAEIAAPPSTLGSSSQKRTRCCT